MIDPDTPDNQIRKAYRKVQNVVYFSIVRLYCSTVLYIIYIFLTFPLLTI